MDFWKKGDAAQRDCSGGVSGPEMSSARPKTARDASDIMGLLGPSVRIKGDIFFDCTLRIDGTLEGDVVSPDELFIGKTGSVKGDVTVRRINVSGRLDGQLYALENAEIENGAQVNGLIVARMLQVREGAQIQARMLMGEFARQILAEKAALPGIAAPAAAMAPDPGPPGETGEISPVDAGEPAGEREPISAAPEEPGADAPPLPPLREGPTAEPLPDAPESSSPQGKKRHKRG